jgi:hypothetical protein
MQSHIAPDARHVDSNIFRPWPISRKRNKKNFLASALLHSVHLFVYPEIPTHKEETQRTATLNRERFRRHRPRSTRSQRKGSAAAAALLCPITFKLRTSSIERKGLHIGLRYKEA